MHAIETQTNRKQGNSRSAHEHRRFHSRAKRSVRGARKHGCVRQMVGAGHSPEIGGGGGPAPRAAAVDLVDGGAAAAGEVIRGPSAPRRVGDGGTHDRGLQMTGAGEGGGGAADRRRGGLRRRKENWGAG